MKGDESAKPQSLTSMPIFDLGSITSSFRNQFNSHDRSGLDGVHLEGYNAWDTKIIPDKLVLVRSGRWLSAVPVGSML
jgi:hypothetical protein